ncbi:flavin reductase family protein [Methanobrevibacter olleyae]|uniref:flavin reductase family protein n=1 Tax=Methanobrevibacter olleyae TaxID=294671 RepID=UPI0009F6DD85
MLQPPINQVAETDYLGIASGYDEDKLEKLGFTTTKAQEVNAPIINELKVSVECRAINIIEIGSHTQITGEILNIQVSEDVLGEKGKVDLKLLNPIVYDDVLYDYFKVGDKIADAFNVGRKFR